jgi:hypothetical protein
LEWYNNFGTPVSIISPDRQGSPIIISSSGKCRRRCSNSLHQDCLGPEKRRRGNQVPISLNQENLGAILEKGGMVITFFRSF